MNQHLRTHRPVNCEPGYMASRTREMGDRLRLSRERLAASALARNTRAWRLWAACVDATVGYTREADMTYAVTLGRAAGMDRKVSGPLLRRFDELGVFRWKAAPRGSHQRSELALPALSGGQRDPVRHRSGGQSDPVRDAAQGVNVGALHSNESMSVESMSNEASIDTGTHHSSPSLTGAPPMVEGSEAGKPSMEGPEPDPAEIAAMVAAIEADLDAAEPSAAELFPPFHGDERTGDTTGESERELL